MKALEHSLQRWRDFLTLRARGLPAARQAGAIPYTVVRGQHVFLLITSRRTGRWIFPKGELIAGMTPWQVAAHEAFEEAGVEGEIETSPLGSYRTVKTRGLLRSVIEVDLYPLQLGRQFEEWPEKGYRHRHWAILPEAKRLLSEPRLAELAAGIVRRSADEPQPAKTFISQ